MYIIWPAIRKIQLVLQQYFGPRFFLHHHINKYPDTEEPLLIPRSANEQAVQMPRTPDFAVALTLALLGSTVLLYPHPLTYLRASLLALCAALAAFVLYVSSRPAKWICVTPPESNDKLGSSLRPTRASGSRLPCPYPNAWYCLTLTNELPPGAVLQGNACGKLFVVWRPTELADDGVSWRDAVVMDSFCPHLGANLAAGGIVDNGCLRCPFHGWTFDKSGCVVNVPGADTCPPHASVRTFESRERNGVISVWLGCEDHDRGKAPRVIRDAPSAEEKSSKLLATTKPQYSIPTFPQLNGSSCWVYHGFSEHVVNALLWEIPENGSDVAQLSNTMVLRDCFSPVAHSFLQLLTHIPLLRPPDTFKFHCY